MGLSGLVDIAIGLILMYLVLSLICTTVNELIATSLKWRAKDLAKSLIWMIDNGDLRKAFYNSGLIANTTTAARGGGPLPGAPAPASSGKGNQTDAAGEPKDTAHPSYLDGRIFALALLDSLTVTPQAQVAGAAPPQTAFPSFEEIKRIVGDLPDSNIRDVLLANIATGEQSVTGLRDSVAAWYDTSMDRLSGDYKRSLKVLSLVIGMAVAFGFNADSLSVGRALWRDEALRGQIVNSAQQFIDAAPVQAQCQADGANPVSQTSCLLDKFKSEQDGLRPFPIGWPDHDLASRDSKTPVLPLVVSKFFGCLFTGFALSLGAPFWFDLLQKFMNLRGAGIKPERESEKKHKKS